MNIFLKQAVVIAALTFGLAAVAQTASKPAPGTPQAPQSTPPVKPAPLQLQTLESATLADPFPPVDAKNFTADSPTVATVDSYLKAVLGYDTGRIWRVEAIQKTAAPGVSRVTTLVSERVAGAKVLNAIFYVMPDGAHLIADGSGVASFGANPFAEADAALRAGADGPFRGAAGKRLMLVEFADLQCPQCKAAQATMDRLLQDFPSAHVVYQNFPLPEVHPYALLAASYGVCVAKAGNDSFFKYVQTVYDTQAGLTAADAQKTLDAAVTKTGGDPKAVATCAASASTRAQVASSTRLGTQIGVGQTPVLSVNGRLVPLAAVPYDTLRQIVAYQAAMDGVQTAAPTLGR